jgi:hypothetical protein
MAANIDIPDLQRMTFFSGQRLTAADLTELQRTNRELRWLHNRSLHGWGLGIGLGVTGERGATIVTVEPGYGVDCLGREIILTETRQKTVPAVAGGSKGEEVPYYLVVAYKTDAEQKVAERRPGVCMPEGTVRLGEEPRIEWRRPDQLQEGLDLILAQAWIRNCKLSRPLSLTGRRSARPSHQPYVAAGQTVAGKTDWKEWNMNNDVAGVITQVNTSAAHFRSTPRYMAHIVGDRVSEDGTLVDGFAQVCNPTPTGFEMRVLMPRDLQVGASVLNQAIIFSLLHLVGQPSELVRLLGELKWQVVWMGIEG